MIKSHPLVQFPMVPVEETTRPVLALEQFRELVDAMDKVPVAAMVAFLGETGARKSEALNLQWKDLDFRDGVVALQHTKNRKVRRVSLSDYAQTWLLKLVRYVSCPYVFVNSRTGKRWVNPEKAFERGARAAKLS